MTSDVDQIGDVDVALFLNGGQALVMEQARKATAVLIDGLVLSVLYLILPAYDI